MKKPRKPFKSCLEDMNTPVFNLSPAGMGSTPSHKFQPGDVVTFTTMHKVGGKFDHHSWSTRSHEGHILSIHDGIAIIAGEDRLHHMEVSRLQRKP